VSDPSGNGPTTVTRDVIVYDSVAPVITSGGNDVIELQVFEQFFDPGVNISDNSTTGFTIHTYGTFFETFASGIPTQIGTYSLFYYVKDAAGNKSNILGRIIHVVDISAPDIELIGGMYAQVDRWQTYVDAGYSVTDNYYPPSQLHIDTNTTVNTQVLGVYLICYTATDPSGNISPDVCRMVEVKTPISGIGNSMLNTLGVYPNPSIGKFTVNCSESIIGRLSIENILGEEIIVRNNQDQFLSKLDVDLSEFPSGVYTLRIQTPYGIFTDKIMLSK
jgi:hypothetical protein